LPDSLAELDVFYGDLTPNLAYIYARLPRLAEPGEWSLTGTVRGPRCLHAETLPTVTRLVDLGTGPTLLARATVTEPVFWSPDLPAIYDVTVNLLRGTEIVATAQREIGLRALGVRGSNLWLAGKTFVSRGVSVSSTNARLPRAWHEEMAMYVTDDTNHEPLAEASQWGALGLVEVDATADLATRLRNLARYPAVAITALRGEMPPDFSKRTAAPNLLLAQVVEAGQPLVSQQWAELLFVDFRDVQALRELHERTDKPLLLRRPLAEPHELVEARAWCDVLQREAAAVGQFAGYIV
jgi:hypothetical protein